MIPLFPNFKSLEVSDKDDIESHTKNFPPYSDFNFVSMWSWDITSEMRISNLHGNLVVKFTDYITGEPFYSFIGSSNKEKTIADLLHQQRTDFGEGNHLKLLPEICVSDITDDGLQFDIDSDNFDYIFNIDQLSTYSGALYTTKRNLVNRFHRQYPKSEAVLLDLSQIEIQQKLLELDKIWFQDKQNKDFALVSNKETIALQRLFLIEKSVDLVTIGILVDGKLIAFCINELLSEGYAISHFAKTIPDSAGVYAHLMQENAKVLKTNNRAFLNFEQDLGLSNLRYAKKSFRPTHHLKKYSCLKKEF